MLLPGWTCDRLGMLPIWWLKTVIQTALRFCSLAPHTRSEELFPRAILQPRWRRTIRGGDAVMPAQVRLTALNTFRAGPY